MLAGSSGAILALMTAVAVRMPDYPVNFLLVGEVRMKWLAPIAILLTVLRCKRRCLDGACGEVFSLELPSLLISRRQSAEPFSGYGREDYPSKTRKIFNPPKDGPGMSPIY